MAYDNRRDQTNLLVDHGFFTAVLPGSLATTLATPIARLHPSAPDDDPPVLEDMNRYAAGSRSPHDAWLTLERRRYRYTAPADNPVAPIALAARVPLTANYDLRWAARYMPVLLPVLGHVLASRVRFAWQRLRGTYDRFAAYRQIYDGVLPCGDLPVPAPVHDYFEDAAFASQRLDGPNPVQIARVPDRDWVTRKLPAYTPAQFAAATGHDLDAELAAGNVYACDYELLQASLRPRARRDSRWRATYLPAPILLLWYGPGRLRGSDLVPVAIQLDQPDAVTWDQPDFRRPAVAVPPALVTPDMSERWALARTLVQCADQNIQVNSTHVGRTHWLIEPFALAVPRQLPPDHPLYLLAEPHIRFTLAVNQTTIPLITVPGKIFSAIYAGTLQETRQIMIDTHARWSFRELALERDLQARGMDTYPGRYPYREDARRLWAATFAFVDRYLRIFYRSDVDVVRDAYLQAFVDELVDPARGNVRGLLAGPRLATVDELVEIVAQFVFTCGPQHAAVHYPQLEYFTYVPASPGAAYLPPPIGDQPVRPDRTLATLPPEHHAIVQFQTDQIGNYRYDRFGDYSRYRLGRSQVPGVPEAIAAFDRELGRVQQDIERDNHDPAVRARPYVYLLPSNIPNSINI